MWAHTGICPDKYCSCSSHATIFLHMGVFLFPCVCVCVYMYTTSWGQTLSTFVLSQRQPSHPIPFGESPRGQEQSSSPEPKPCSWCVSVWESRMGKGGEKQEGSKATEENSKGLLGGKERIFFLSSSSPRRSSLKRWRPFPRTWGVRHVACCWCVCARFYRWRTWSTDNDVNNGNLFCFHRLASPFGLEQSERLLTLDRCAYADIILISD